MNSKKEVTSFRSSSSHFHKVLRDCITGKKLICLAITEPWAGSDVANIQTTARREGDYYIVNGQKKFITGAMKSDYFTVAVRTGGPGRRGISLLLLEKDMPGITLRRMKTQVLTPQIYLLCCQRLQFKL
jgi:alkylation response protein AidB-like acyl-CoA dehydrogenase